MDCMYGASSANGTMHAMAASQAIHFIIYYLYLLINNTF